MGPLEHGDPDRIGRYRLIGRLGAGGMGQVFFGRSSGGRAVAVKRIHPHLAADPSFRERFAREVTAARQVSGAFTAPVIDADPDGEVPWLVTSYVPSLPLDEGVQAHGPLPEASLRVLATGLAEALAEIHRVGLIHRDLKPGNVLLAEDGPRVIDFGIARATEGAAATQSIIGTPGFMSPEQVQGEHMTPASDLFAYGAVLVYAASGTGPFGEGAMPTMVMRIIQERPDIAAVPPSLQRVVAACLEKDPRNRPGTGQLLDHLGDVPAGGSWLPPSFQQGVRDQVEKVNAALGAAPDTVSGATSPGAGAAGRTSVMGAAAAGAAAGALGGAAAGYAAADGATARYEPEGGADATARFQQGTQGLQAGADPATAQYPGAPDRTAQFGQAGQAQPTAQFGQTAGYPQTAQYGQVPGTQPPPYHPEGPGAAAAAPPAGQQGGDAYSDLYRDSAGGHRREAQRTQQMQEERRRQEQQQEEQRRRQEAERAHRERLRAEERAARRAQDQARKASQPSLWSFIKLVPLLIIPILQIPLGWGAAHAWQWITSTDAWWGQPWYYQGMWGESLLSGFNYDGFVLAMQLGYFLLNNVVSLEYLVRSLRSGFVAGILLSAVALVATNAALASFGFFGAF
ncbi:serine/threonine-protein kinase [Nocardiopsis sp. RSe5-2]|uniref:non-specific serine/threonine protein kinase n=1 Tax=Nocardiopsis endophytica TaxID=3018445 RepID=A0ABT4U7E5_9ACTN|nr:serine/threonine-protein kinase [Nocardiopsis endophytica]MDA2812851.1 serine/threonine-protein kinase [Nocardiopsis endophytica]